MASPVMQKMYADLVIASAPESEEAKLLSRNYQKIIDRITMANPKSCTHIKINGVRCESPALRGEQFCYFHQHAHRGVRHPPRSRLHPMALIESQESIQASLMEVINGLLRNTLDAKRAELILRALHIAVKNARNVKFDSEVDPKVREVPEYAEPAIDSVETDAFGAPLSEIAADPADESLPAVAAVPYKPVDARDPHWLERMEEGGRVLAREERERRAAEARAARPAAAKDDSSRIAGRDASTAPRPSLRSDAAPLSMTWERDAASKLSDAIGTTIGEPGKDLVASPQGLPQASRDSKAGSPSVDPTKRKPPVSVNVDVRSNRRAAAVRRR